VQALERFLGNGELGDVVGVRAGAYTAQPPAGWRARRAESGGGAFTEHGFNLVDLALWLTGFPEPVRVTAHMATAQPAPRGRQAAAAVEDSMLVSIECTGGMSVGVDVSWSYIGEEERNWFEVLLTRGSARLAPLRVVKELNGRPVDVSPSGASARESAFLQSYRAQLTHFLAVLAGQTPYEPPADQVVVARLMERCTAPPTSGGKSGCDIGGRRRARGGRRCGSRHCWRAPARRRRSRRRRARRRCRRPPRGRAVSAGGAGSAEPGSEYTVY
jgi:predicted dehydrogenase